VRDGEDYRGVDCGEGVSGRGGRWVDSVGLCCFGGFVQSKATESVYGIVGGDLGACWGCGTDSGGCFCGVGGLEMVL
jgi:hypothetical protein